MISSLDKVKRRASRIGFQPVKFITTIVVHQLVLPVENHIKNNSVLSICFEKGGKISTSDDIVYDLDQTDINLVERGSSNMSMVIELDERLELVSTLYRDPLTGIFQKKQGKIILRQLQTSSVTGMSSFKGIGIYTINLHEVAQSMGYDKMLSKDLEMPLEQLSGASLEATVTNKIVYLQSEDDADDAHSVNSLASDMSTVGATFFSYDDVTDYVCQDEIVGMSSYVDSSPSHLRRGSGVHIARVVVGSYERKFNPISRRPSAAVFVEGSESTPTVGSSLSKVFDSMLPVEDDAHSSSNSIDHHSSDVNKSLQASNNDDEEQMVIGPTVDDDATTSSSSTAAASTPAANKSLVDSRPSLEEPSSSSSSSIAVEAVSSPVTKKAVMVHRGTTTHEDFAFVEYTRSLAPVTYSGGVM